MMFKLKFTAIIMLILWVSAFSGCDSDEDSNGPETNLYIGMEYQGGLIAYILQSGDPGYVSGETHGIIVSISEQSAGGDATWATAGYWNKAVPNGTGTAIGTGTINTDRIIAQNGVGTSYAAGRARAWAFREAGDYKDWYLPSKDELNKLYLNREAIGGNGFHNDGYWSSSENGAGYAWGQYFLNGTQSYTNKSSNDIRVRAVRAF